MKRFITIFKNYYRLIDVDKGKLVPYYVGYFINIFVELGIPVYVAKITENLTNSLYLNVLVSIVMYWILSTFNNLISYFNRHTYSNFFKDNYITMYKKIVKEIYEFDPEYKSRFSSGRMLTSLTNDIVQIGEMANDILTIVLNMLKLLIVMFYFLKINRVFAIIVILVDIYYIKRSNYLSNRSVFSLNKQREENDKLIGLINQTLLGLKDVQTLDLSENLDEKFDLLYEKWKEAYSYRRKYQIYRETILNCLLVSVRTSLYFICAYLVINGQMSIGTMLIVLTYLGTLFSSSRNIMSSLENVKGQNVSIERIEKILKYNNSKSTTEIENMKVKGSLEFKNVYFSYNEEPLLKNINFSIKPNTLNAIIGSNGAGKTTIVDLILRLYTPRSGKILLDGIDIEKIDKKIYLKEVSILNQEPYLFNLSIRQNFDLIDRDRNHQQDICKLLKIEKFINGLPDGYNSIIDENSSNISGGQKRLLSLARTLLKNSKILILDEATTFLDRDMIKNTIDILNTLKINHTIIVITHKKEIIEIADKVIKVENGEIK